jgi:hypothetical protein
MEVSMNRRIATLAAAAAFAAGLAIAPSAFAGGNVAVSIGLPGFSVGYSNHGYGYIAATPAPYYGTPYYTAPYYAAPYYAPAPVVTYAPYAPVAYAPYYRPYAAHPYNYRPPVRVGYYGYARHY